MARALPIPGAFVNIAMDRWTAPFWQAAKTGSLVAARCGTCGRFRMPPGPFCPSCRSQQVDWPVLSGEGILYSFAICHRSPFPEQPDFTYVPAVVELPDAGNVRLVTNLVEVDTDAVRIGMRLRVVFSPITDGWQVPLFKPD